MHSNYVKNKNINTVRANLMKSVMGHHVLQSVKKYSINIRANLMINVIGHHILQLCEETQN